MDNSLNRVLTAENLASCLSRSRTELNKSQKYMAQALGKSVGTIQHWEDGIGSPNLLDFLEWFNVLGLNPMRYLLDFLYPDTFEGIESSDEIRQALIGYLKDNAPDSEIKKLAFCIFGNTGSSWHSQLDMLCAHNHTPMQSRISVASAITTNYAIAQSLDKLECTDHIMPDINNLKDSIDKAIQSVCDNKKDIQT